MSDTRIIQRGIAKILTVSGALDAYVGIALNTLKAKHNWKNLDVQDFAGFDFGWNAINPNIVITINYKLTAASFAVAQANGVFLGELTEVALSGFDLAWLNTTGVGGFWTGHWCYHEGGSIDLSNDNPGGAEIMLRKYKDPTQNAAQFSIPA